MEESAVRIDFDRYQLPLPPRIAALMQQLLERTTLAWEHNRSASTTPWLIPGLNPARPLGHQYLSVKMREHDLPGLAGRNTARLAMAMDIPSAILAEATGTGVDSATRWATFAKRDWAAYIAARREADPS